jgi:hypothetical protein
MYNGEQTHKALWRLGDAAGYRRREPLLRRLHGSAYRIRDRRSRHWHVMPARRVPVGQSEPASNGTHGGMAVARLPIGPHPATVPVEWEGYSARQRICPNPKEAHQPPPERPVRTNGPETQRSVGCVRARKNKSALGSESRSRGAPRPVTHAHLIVGRCWRAEARKRIPRHALSTRTR